MSTTSLLRGLLQAIEPSKTQKDGARRSHSYLRDLLNTGDMASKIDDSYLSGSYARTTAIAPLDDVDIIFIIDPAEWERPFFASRPQPKTVLATFERAIRYRYPDSSLRTQRRSVRLRMHHLDIDVVPAIQGEGDVIYIGDKDRDAWITTAPKGHSTFATEVNKRCAQQAKPLVKLLKHWNSTLPPNAQLKSFAMETMVLRYASPGLFTSLEEGVCGFFQFLSQLAKPFFFGQRYGMENIVLGGIHVPDAANTGSNVAAGVDNDRKGAFFRHVHRANELLESEHLENSLENVFSLQ